MFHGQMSNYTILHSYQQCVSDSDFLHPHQHQRSEVKFLSRVRLLATPQTIACYAPPSMGFSRQEYWSRLPFPSSEDLPDPGIKPRSPALQADALPSEPPGKSNSMFKRHQFYCSRTMLTKHIQKDHQRKILENGGKNEK